MFSDPANYYGNNDLEESIHLMPPDAEFEWHGHGHGRRPNTRKPKYQVVIPRSFLMIIGLTFLCFPMMFITMSFEHLMENKEKNYMEAQQRKKDKRKRKKFNNNANFTADMVSSSKNVTESNIDNNHTKKQREKIESARIEREDVPTNFTSEKVIATKISSDNARSSE